MASNPFTPTFGVVPAFMAGREDITSELLAALEEGVGNPNLTTIISGARGTGKTALLTYLSDAAQAQGCVSVNVSALPGMLEEIVQQAGAASAHLIDTSASAKLEPEAGRYRRAAIRRSPRGGSHVAHSHGGAS